MDKPLLFLVLMIALVLSGCSSEKEQQELRVIRDSAVTVLRLSNEKLNEQEKWLKSYGEYLTKEDLSRLQELQRLNHKCINDINEFGGFSFNGYQNTDHTMELREADSGVYFFNGDAVAILDKAREIGLKEEPEQLRQKLAEFKPKQDLKTYSDNSTLSRSGTFAFVKLVLVAQQIANVAEAAVKVTEDKYLKTGYIGKPAVFVTAIAEKIVAGQPYFANVTLTHVVEPSSEREDLQQRWIKDFKYEATNGEVTWKESKGAFPSFSFSPTAFPVVKKTILSPEWAMSKDAKKFSKNQKELLQSLVGDTLEEREIRISGKGPFLHNIAPMKSFYSSIDTLGMYENEFTVNYFLIRRCAK